MDPRRYAVIGCGAIGGYYGARLAHAGCEVHFLAHRDVEHIRKHGLTVTSPDGDFSIARPHVYGAVSEIPPCDVVLVALKSVHNHLLQEMLPRLVTPDTTVALFQNGLGAEEDIAAWCRPRAVLGGLCFICSHKQGPGHIRHMDYGRVTLAAWAPELRAAGNTTELLALGHDLEQAGVPVLCSDDLVLARWMKLVWNIPFNGLCVLLNSNTRELVADPSSRELVRQLMEEVRRGARSMDRDIPASFVDAMIRDTETMAPYQPSMQLDFEAGRPPEIEAIYERPLQTAAKHGVDLPRIDTLARCLRVLAPTEYN